jgi:pilus assembly protein CpaC
VDYREFGTQVDFVPIVLGNGQIRLEVRPQISSLDAASGVTFGGISVPGLRSRGVDTACELQAGQTFALAGLIQQTVEARNTGIPLLADLPWIGAMFRRVEEQTNEIELMILVTPELIGPMDAHEVPPCGPGQLTTSPSDHELYGRGYIEVPNCCNDGNCPQCRGSQYLPADVPPHAGAANNPYRAFYPSSNSVRNGNSHGSMANPAPVIVGPVGYDVIE